MHWTQTKKGRERMSKIASARFKRERVKARIDPELRKQVEEETQVSYTIKQLADKIEGEMFAAQHRVKDLEGALRVLRGLK
jgi:hypothetical protein